MRFTMINYGDALPEQVTASTERVIVVDFLNDKIDDRIKSNFPLFYFVVFMCQKDKVITYSKLMQICSSINTL